MTPDELAQYAQENGERFWRDAGNHWLNDKLNLMSSSRVIEIGGYLGNWTDYVYEKYQCLIDTYEPVKEYADRMAERFSIRPKITVVNAAVDAYSGEAAIAMMNDGSSLYNGGFDKAPVVKVVDITTVIMRRETDLLALNCEGAEYPILDRLLGAGLGSSVKTFLIQFHTFFPDAEARRDRIRKELAKTHWETFSYPFCWERWERK